MPALLERLVSFNYDFQVRCPTCRGLTGLDSQTYDAEPDSAHIACGRCGSDIHFGSAVLGCREADDPALREMDLASFAWYHTSTDPEWPQHGVSLPDSTFEGFGLPSNVVRDVHRQLTTQALHVGTYEAAVESMLRRMCDQEDGGSQFYLFRVRLRSGLRLEAGYRDENHDEAAQITQPALATAGLDGIRYLNVHESPGSISLALQRRAIAAVQTIAIPTPELRTPVPESLLVCRAGLFEQIDVLTEQRSPELDVLDQLRKRAAATRGAPFVRSPTVEQHELAKRAEQLLIDEFLTGVSRPVRFGGAMRAWAAAQVSALDQTTYVRRFAAMAALLTRPDEVLRQLGGRPWRMLE